MCVNNFNWTACMDKIIPHIQQHMNSLNKPRGFSPERRRIWSGPGEFCGLWRVPRPSSVCSWTWTPSPRTEWSKRSISRSSDAASCSFSAPTCGCSRCGSKPKTFCDVYTWNWSHNREEKQNKLFAILRTSSLLKRWTTSGCWFWERAAHVFREPTKTWLFFIVLNQ